MGRTLASPVKYPAPFGSYVVSGRTHSQQALSGLRMMRAVLVRQIALSVHCRHATLAGCGDSLSIKGIDHIARRKDSWYFCK